MNAFVEEVLTNCYPYAEYARDMEIINESKIIVTFFFPSYKRALRDIDYASVNQIIPAISEGLYIVAGHYVKNNANDAGFTYKEFPEKMWIAIFREFEKLVLSKKVPSEVLTGITFEVVKTEKVKNFNIFYFKFFGSVRGKIKCLIPM